MIDKSKPPKFVGAYVDDIRLAALASMVSHEHLAVLGAPGTGKTDILDKLAITAVGQDARSFSRFAPSTPPQRIEGVFDTAAALGDPARGIPPKFMLVRDGTPYDPRVRIAVMDEWFRASDIVFDLGLDVCDRRDVPQDESPVVWATSNFAATSARTEALRDRFGIWYWIRPGNPDVAAIIRAHANSMHSTLYAGDMPDWQTVCDIRSADPGPKSIKVCTEILSLLAQEAGKAGLVPNPRRIRQWFRLLYRTNVYYHGTADFTYSHEDASRVLVWAWANTDEQKASEWSKIASCVVDIIGTAINELKQKTLQQVKNILNKTSGKVQSNVVIALGEIITEGKSEIEKLGIDDRRIKVALDELQQVFVEIAQGKNPFESE